MDHDHENYHDYDRHGFCSVLGDLAVSLGLNPLYLMLPAAVNISFMMMMMIVMIMILLMMMIMILMILLSIIMMILMICSGDLLLCLHAPSCLPDQCNCLQSLRFITILVLAIIIITILVLFIIITITNIFITISLHLLLIITMPNQCNAIVYKASGFCLKSHDSVKFDPLWYQLLWGLIAVFNCFFEEVFFGSICRNRNNIQFHHHHHQTHPDNHENHQ